MRVRIAAVLLFVTGCSQEPQHWQTAAAADTRSGYEMYLAEHPDGANAGEAESRLLALRGDSAWAQVSAELDADALHGFLSEFPDHPAANLASTLHKIYARAGELEAEDMRMVKAEITSLGANDSGITFHFDEKVDMSGVGMLAEDMSLSNAATLFFDEADRAVGNRVQLHMAKIEQQLGQMKLKHWVPLGFVIDPTAKQASAAESQ